MAKWEVVTFGPGKEYVTLYCDGNDILDDAPIVCEIARKMNAFDELVSGIEAVRDYVAKRDFSIGTKTVAEALTAILENAEAANV